MEQETTTGAASWFAVRTRSNYEVRVQDELLRKGFETYLPQLCAGEKRGQISWRPMYRSYLFVRYQPFDDHRIRVLQTNGVCDLLGMNGRPEPIPEPEIDAVRFMLQSGLRCAGHPSLREGDPVRIIRGPLRNVEGRLIRTKSRLRLVVGISLLAAGVSAEVDAADIEPAGSPH